MSGYFKKKRTIVASCIPYHERKNQCLVTHLEFWWQHILLIGLPLWFSCWTIWKADISDGAQSRKKAQQQIQSVLQAALPSRLYSPTDSMAHGVSMMNTWIHSEYRRGIPGKWQFKSYSRETSDFGARLLSSMAETTCSLQSSPWLPLSPSRN